STELGLNSQGIPRHVVAAEVPRKLISFFAEGGKSVSWFCTLYPDPEGKNEGSSGQSHNLFDSRFNRYCPKLDAVSYYNVINAVANKKFVGEREYPAAGDEKTVIRAHLFRDGQGKALQAVWADRGSHDVAIPLPGVRTVEVVRIDGVRRTLTPTAPDSTITLTATEEPLLLLYDEPQPAELPASLAGAAARVTQFPKSAKGGQPVTLTVELRPGTVANDVELVAPPFWTIDRKASASAITFTLTPPPAGTTAHHVDVTIRTGKSGELHRRAVVTD
ncbi:MAG TPA: hypothetical protein VK986_18355, partial [Tepidisphaeraceae bacterium]|nr:hypothetical protein [Tepidisphaeraceae bacterium]